MGDERSPSSRNTDIQKKKEKGKEKKGTKRSLGGFDPRPFESENTHYRQERMLPAKTVRSNVTMGGQRMQ